MEVYDADGNLVEGMFSQEEVDAQIEEAKKAFIPVTTDAPVAPPVVDIVKKDDEDVIAKMQEQINTLVRNSQLGGTSKYLSGLDADKSVVFNKQFDDLGKTGSYEDTPDGLQKRSEAAYLLTVGQPFDYNALNMGNLSAVSGRTAAKPADELTEVDRGLASMFGNTVDDYKKYGNSETK